ncbi:MAG: hypothetical protein ACKVQS_02245 [Fimbriimonadaceae bacterium]
MPEFTNVPLEEVALRLTLSAGIAWNLERAMRLHSVLGNDFQVIKETHGLEQIPGMDGYMTEIPFGAIAGIELQDTTNGVRLMSQANLVKVSWHQGISPDNKYVRFDYLLDLLVKFYGILQKLVDNPLPVMVANMSYLDKVNDGKTDAEYFLEKYLDRSSFPSLFPDDAHVNHVDSSWKLADGIDIRFQFRRIEEPTGYAFITSGGKILEEGDQYGESLKSIRVHLHEFFLKQLSENGKKEFGLL